MILVLISFENKKHAKKVADYLVDEKLAACVSLIPVASFYYWKGKKVVQDEVEAVVKTKKENFAKIEATIEQLLPYEVPQLIALEATAVNQKYLDWLNKNCL